MRIRDLLVSLLAFSSLMPVGAQAQTKINVAYGLAADFLPAFVAREEGLFAKNNLDVTMTAMVNSSLVPAALVGGSAQIGINTGPNLVLAADSGLDLVAVTGAARLQKADPHIFLLTRAGMPVTRAEDLQGRKVGIPGINSVIDLFFRKWMMNHKMAPDAVTLIEVPPLQMADRLKSGQLDAVAIFEPLASRIVQSSGAARSLDFFSEVNPDVLGSLWAATRSWATANPQSVAAFRASLKDALAQIASNPARARQIEAKYLGFAAPTFPDFAQGVSVADIETFVRLGNDLKILRGPVDAARLVLP